MKNLLLERDFLILDPQDRMVTGDLDKLVFRKTAAFGATISVYGAIGTSDMTGEKTVEDMEIWLGDGEITNGLPENFIQELVSACIEGNP